MVELHIPRSGDVWEYYKGARYTIHSLAINSDGRPYVVYSDLIKR